jgi:voltage-gated potassium channel
VGPLTPAKGNPMRRSRSRRYEDLTESERHRREAVELGRSTLVGVLLVVAYYVVPLDRPADAGVLLLVAGLILIAGVLAWQTRAILLSPFPRLRGFQTLITGIPLLLVVFSAVYYLIELAQADNFTQPTGKIDAMYFTVTVFSTAASVKLPPRPTSPAAS